MQCWKCGKEIDINREFCPQCGSRQEVKFEEIAASVKRDAASRRGKSVEDGFKFLLIGLVIVFTIIFGFNDLWDEQMTYSGATLPVVPSPGVAEARLPTIVGPYRDYQGFKAIEPQPPLAFGYRSHELVREKLIVANGGSEDTKEAVKKGLSYLARLQEGDGGWEIDTKKLNIKPERSEALNFKWGRVGVTGLSLLAFLGEGELWFQLPGGERPRYKRTLERGLSFLVKAQDEANGRYGPTEGQFMYNHGMATMAVAEAAGMSGDPHLRESAQRGIDLIQRIQGSDGGWGFRDGVNEKSDSSVSAWQVMSLLAGREAGLKVDAEVLKKALAYYTKASDPKTGEMTSDRQHQHSHFRLAFMLRQRLGDTAENDVVKMLKTRTMEELPTAKKAWGRGWHEGKDSDVNDDERARTYQPYEWFFGTYGMFYFGGDDWNQWNSSTTKALLLMQSADGSWKGNDIWSVKVGPAYSTALSVMALQVYYRNH